MMKIIVGDDTSVLKDLGIKTLPTFVMFHCGRIAYAGPVGGRKVKAATASSRAQVLIIEPNFSDQIAMEKFLRKNECDTFLCLNTGQAIERLQQFSRIGNRGGEVIFDMILISDQIQGLELDILYQKISANVKSRRTIVCAVVSVLGEHGRHNYDCVDWKDFATDEIDKAVVGPLAKIVSLALQKPLKPGTSTLTLTQR